MPITTHEEFFDIISKPSIEARERQDCRDFIDNDQYFLHPNPDNAPYGIEGYIMQGLVTSCANDHTDIAEKLLLVTETLPSISTNLEFVFHVADIANYYNHTDIARRLIHNIGINSTTNDKHESLLMLAAKSGSYKLIELLIQEGADANLKNINDESALMIGSKNKHFFYKNSWPKTEGILKAAEEGLIIDKPFDQNIILSQHNTLLDPEGTCFGFVMESTRYVMKHAANGEKEDEIDVMDKINRKIDNPEQAKNFAKRLALYQTEQNDSKSPAEGVNYNKDDFLGSLNDNQKNIKYLGLTFNTFDQNNQPTGSHIISIRRIADTETYEVIDPNFGSRKCNNAQILNKHIESILNHYNTTEIAVYDIGEIVKQHDLLPEPILETDEVLRNEQRANNKKKKYVLDNIVNLSIIDKNLNLTSELIKDGHDINHHDKFGYTPLMNASLYNNPEAVDLLIQHRVNVNAADPNGKTALMIAAENGNSDITEKLITAGGNVNATNSSEKTALMIAAENGNSDITEKLIAAGGNVNAADNNGKTALMIAAENGNSDITEKLITAGGNVNAADNNGKTALMIAATKGHSDITEKLITEGGNVNAADSNGKTALMIAATKGHSDITEKLIVAGGNVNATDNNNGTPLMYAAFHNKIDAATILITNKAYLNAKDNDGNTALIIAAENEHTDIVNLLIESGADITPKDIDGNTALMIAEQNGNNDIVDILSRKEISMVMHQMVGKIEEANSLRKPSPSSPLNRNGKEYGKSNPVSK